MKPLKFFIIFTVLLFTALTVRANTLNEVVKEARKQGQVLSAKTRQGMHEVRVVTPQGSVKTIRKPADQNSQGQRQPELNNRQNYYQQPIQPSRQHPVKPTQREYRHSRQPEFHSFQRPSQTTRVPNAHRPTQQPPTQQRHQPPASRSDDRDPD